MIIFDALGQKTIPENFESSFKWIEEGGLGDEFNNGREGEQLILKLNESINKYNSLCNNTHKIPNTIKQMVDGKIMQQSNYNLLSCLSQIQLYVTINGKF